MATQRPGHHGAGSLAQPGHRAQRTSVRDKRVHYSTSCRADMKSPPNDHFDEGVARRAEVACGCEGAQLLRQSLDHILAQADALLLGGGVGVVVGDDSAHDVGAVGLGALLPGLHPFALVPLI